MNSKCVAHARKESPTLRSAHSEHVQATSLASTVDKGWLHSQVAAAAGAILLLLAAALLLLSGCASNPGSSTTAPTASNPATEPVSKAQVGDAVQFGGYQWRVLAKEDGKALLITEYAIDARAYNEESAFVTWENCTLRHYLNGEFYNSFDGNQKKAIAETDNANDTNPDYSTPGGNETTGKVFCLSFEEASKYFSSDGDRSAKFNGAVNPWWLRSPGFNGEYAAYISDDGHADPWGFFVDNTYRGVSPALWVNH